MRLHRKYVAQKAMKESFLPLLRSLMKKRRRNPSSVTAGTSGHVSPVELGFSRGTPRFCLLAILLCLTTWSCFQSSAVFGPTVLAKTVRVPQIVMSRSKYVTLFIFFYLSPRRITVWFVYANS